MEREPGTTSVFMSTLPMGSTLSHECEAQPQEDGFDLAWLQDRDLPQCSGDPNGVSPDEFRTELWFTVLQQHLDDLP